jgi:hypothetical protein
LSGQHGNKSRQLDGDASRKIALHGIVRVIACWRNWPISRAKRVKEAPPVDRNDGMSFGLRRAQFLTLLSMGAFL